MTVSKSAVKFGLLHFIFSLLKLKTMKTVLKLKKTKCLLATLALFLVCSHTAFSQVNYGLYFSDMAVQRNQYNPAFASNARFFIGIPLLGSVNSEYGSTFKFSDYAINKEGSVYASPAGLVSALDESNVISANSTLNIIHFGFTRGKNSFGFGLNNRVSSLGMYSKDLASLMLQGNGNFIGKTTTFNNNKYLSNFYQEFFICYTRQVNDKLTIGITPKFLTGIFNVWAPETDFTLTIDENTYEHEGTSNITIHTSSPVQSLTGFGNDLMQANWMQFSNNLGYAIDIGIKYDISDKIEIAASLLDFGNIYWDEDVKNFNAINKNKATYNGLDIDNIFDGNDFNGLSPSKVMNGFSDSFNLEESYESYSSPLIPRVLLSGSYTFYEQNKIGGVICAEFFGGEQYMSFAFNYSHAFGEILFVNINYNNHFGIINSFGAALVLQVNALQCVFATNNVLGVVNPYNSNNYDFSLGLNIVLN